MQVARPLSLAILACLAAAADPYDLQPPTSDWTTPTFVSAPFDAGGSAAWFGISWTDSPGWGPLPDDLAIPNPAAGSESLAGDDTGGVDCWVASATAGEYHYHQALAATPDAVYASLADYGLDLVAGAAGTLAAGQYAVGDIDGIGEGRLYVRLPGDIDPDTLGWGGVRSIVEAADLAPVALWQFNETGGAAFASAAGGPVWTGVGVAAGADGIWDYAVDLPQGAYMTAPRMATMDSQSVAVSMWILFDDDLDPATTENMTLVGRAGLNAPWTVDVAPADVDNPQASLALKVRTAGGATSVRMIGLSALATGAWEHVVLSYDAVTGTAAAWHRGRVAGWEVLPSAAPLVADAGGMVASAALFGWQCTEMLVSSAPLGSTFAEAAYRRGTCGSRMQVSIDGGTTWTDNNGVEGAYIYGGAADLQLGSLAANMMYRLQIWTWDTQITPVVDGVQAEYGEYPDGAFVITVDSAEFGPGMPVALSEQFGADSAGTARYRVSPDGILWYYYSAAAGQWALAASVLYNAATTNTAAETTANLATFPADVPAAEDAYLQIFLVSGRLNQVSLDDVALTYVPGGVRVASPTAATVATYGDELEVAWSPAGTYSGAWDLYYSTDNGATWATIATSRTGTAYTWTIPADAESTQARVRVADHALPLLAASSPAYVVQRPALLWEYPSLGQRLLAGVPATLRWSVRAGVTPSAACVLEYSANNVTWTSIATVDGAAMEHEWEPPQINADIDLRLRDPDSGEAATVAVRIDAGYLVATPAKIYAGAPATITWQASAGTPAMVDLAWSTDAGLSWTYIDRAASVAEATNTYVWRTPNEPSAIVVRVSGGGYSDQVGAILAGVRLLAPAAGQSVVDGATAIVSWRSYGAGAAVRVQYATSESLALEPGTWITLAAGAPNQDGQNTWAWDVDAMPTNVARVRIVSNSDIHLAALSAAFTLEVSP